MDPTEILALLEKPTRDRWRFVYQIRDEANVAGIVAALRASTYPKTRDLLCYILNLRAGAEFFEGRSSETKQAVPALIEALADSNTDVRSSAIDALGHIGDPAAGPALLEVYRQEHDDFGWRVSLASILGFCQYAPAMPTLIEALSSPNGLLRRQATWGLRHLHAQEAKEPLQKALAQEADPLTHQTMQETLEELEHPSTYEETIDRLIAQLRSAETTQEREAAVTALGDMDKRVLPSMLALLHDKQDEVRHAAALAISAMSEHRDAAWFVRAYREQVQGPLIQALADQESTVRQASAQALGQWGDERAVEPLLAIIQDEDAEVRRQVIETIGYPKDERTLEPLLHAFFTDPDVRVRAYAAQGLGLFDDRRAVDSLIRGLQDEQPDVRCNAAEMLSWLKDERAADALLQALQDSDQEVREWAIDALWWLCWHKGDDLSTATEEKIRQPLTLALQDESAEVRESAAKIMDWLD